MLLVSCSWRQAAGALPALSFPCPPYTVQFSLRMQPAPSKWAGAGQPGRLNEMCVLPAACRPPLLAGVREVHGTFKRSMPSAMQHTNAHMSFREGGAGGLASARGGGAAAACGDEWSRLVTDAEAVRRVRQKLAALGMPA